MGVVQGDGFAIGRCINIYPQL